MSFAQLMKIILWVVHFIYIITPLNICTYLVIFFNIVVYHHQNILMIYKALMIRIIQIILSAMNSIIQVTINIEMNVT